LRSGRSLRDLYTVTRLQIAKILPLVGIILRRATRGPKKMILPRQGIPVTK
jgi:hypothetical protein